jgi:hypothetical protein
MLKYRHTLNKSKLGRSEWLPVWMHTEQADYGRLGQTNVTQKEALLRFGCSKPGIGLNFFLEASLSIV